MSEGDPPWQVQRFPGAVSWFSPGSFTARPRLEGAGAAQLPNVKCAGDWVVMGTREHGAKGLCQERAFVSGLEAGNALLAELRHPGRRHRVIPVREDEPQVQAGFAVSRALGRALPRFWVR